MKADQLFHPYPRAQESGYRTDVRWITLTDKNGVGLTAQGSAAYQHRRIAFQYGPS